MDIQIINEATLASGSKLFELRCGNKQAYVTRCSHGGFDVCVQNASHRAWGGLGKHYRSLEDALSNFKSAEVKAMVSFAAAN
jgi:hypothetical protein